MNPNILIGILFGVAAVLLAVRLLSDFITFTYQLGYDQGRKDAADWWCRAAEDVEEMKQEMGREENS